MPVIDYEETGSLAAWSSPAGSKDESQEIPVILIRNTSKDEYLRAWRMRFALALVRVLLRLQQLRTHPGP